MLTMAPQAVLLRVTHAVSRRLWTQLEQHTARPLHFGTTLPQLTPGAPTGAPRLLQLLQLPWLLQLGQALQ